MTDISIFGKYIRTRKGNLLICLEINGKNFFFYMTPSTGLRFVSGHEEKRGQYVTRIEWDWALKNWDGAKIETLTSTDLRNAKLLAPQIANNFTFNMPAATIATLPSHHATYSK